MSKLNILSVTLMASSVILSGCGGGSNTTDEAASTITPSQVTTDSSTSIVPVNKATSTSTAVILSGVQGISQIQTQKVQGITKPQNAIVDAEFSNATGKFIYKSTNTNAIGNLTFAVQIDEPDEITDISLYLPDVQQSISLCSSGCGTSFNKTINAFSPQLSGISAGDLRVELFVTDSAQNTAMLDALTINWQPISISAITATRINGTISVNWEGEASLSRYNVYSATEPNVTPNNVLSLNNGTQQLSIQNTNVEITDQDPLKNYYILITGIDENGESGLRVPIKVNSTIIVQNQPAQAITDIIEVNEDTSITTNVIDNDINPDSQSLTLADITLQPQNGQLTTQTNGEVTYTPNPDFTGRDSFTYSILDDENNTSQASVTITVNNVNDAPLAENDTFSLEIDNSLTSDSGALIANDFDLDGDFLFVEATPISEPLHGTLQLNPDGSFEYTDNGTFTGFDSFQYQVTDNNGGTSIGEVNLFTSGEDITPLAVNDSFTVNEDETLTVLAANSILSNDSDPNNLVFTLNPTLLITTEHGQLNIANDGTFTYIPDANYHGIDDFKYEIENSLGETSQAFVSLTVNSVADIPSANTDNYQTDEDATLTINAIDGLLANDSDIDGGTLTINTSPTVPTQQGQLTLVDDGSFTYIPNDNFNGVDTFTYQLINNKGDISTAQVSIAINAVNDAPQAINDSGSTYSDTTLTIDVIANDIDVDGDMLTITAATIAPEYGIVILQNNELVYEPSPLLGDIATINYTVEDLIGEVSTATVTITVTSTITSNANPVATDSGFPVDEDTPLDDTLLANHSDSDGGTLSIITTPLTNVTNGTLVLSADSTFTYTPNANFNGTDSFTYTLSDGQGGFDTAQVTLTVNPINDIPVALPDSYTTLKNTPFTVIASDFNSLLMNDSDQDADTLTVNLDASTNTSSGTLSLHTDGEFTYTPNTDFVGTDSFNYELTDENGGFVTGTATITVISVNANPEAVEDNYTIEEGGTIYYLYTGSIIGGATSISILENDTDADNDTISFDESFVLSPSNGTIQDTFFNFYNGTKYVANNGYVGADSFTYRISDGEGGFDEGRINITITADPDAHGNPLAVTETYVINEDVTLFESTLLDNDLSDQTDNSDETELTVTTTPVEAPENGTLILQSDGSFTYTPNANYSGYDSFEYEITNIYNKTATTMVGININPINDAPIAGDDFFTIEKNSGKYKENDILLDNDSDPEDSHLDINETPITNVQHGTLTLDKHGDIEYTPDTDFVGTDSFVYELVDDQGATDLATVTITVVDND